MPSSLVIQVTPISTKKSLSGLVRANTGLSAWIFANFLGEKWHLILFFFVFLFYPSLEWFLTWPAKGVNPFISIRDQQNCCYSAKSERKVTKTISSPFPFNFLFPLLSPLYPIPFQKYFPSIVDEHSIKYKVINKCKCLGERKENKTRNDIDFQTAVTHLWAMGHEFDLELPRLSELKGKHGQLTDMWSSR